MRSMKNTVYSKMAVAVWAQPGVVKSIGNEEWVRKGTGGGTHCSSMAMATTASVMANWSPTHLRMPPPKGMKAKSDDTSFGYNELPWADALRRTICPQSAPAYCACDSAGAWRCVWMQGEGVGASHILFRGRKAHERDSAPCGDANRSECTVSSWHGRCRRANWCWANNAGIPPGHTKHSEARAQRLCRSRCRPPRSGRHAGQS